MPELIANIPRWLTGFSDWCGCLIFIVLLGSVFPKGKLAAALCIGLVAIVGFMVATDGFNGFLFNVFIACSAVLMFAFIGACARRPVRVLAYCTARAYIVAGFAASLAWQLHTYCYQRYPWWKYSVVQVVFLVGIVALVHLLLYGLENTYKNEFSAMDISRQNAVIAVIIAVVIYFVSSISYGSLETPFDARTDLEAFNVRTMVYLGGVAILFAHHVQVIQLHTRIEKNAFQNILNAQYETYRRSQESIEIINQKHHDLKHQIAVLRHESDVERKNAYLDKMEDEIRLYEAQNKTGNEVLDTVLTSKSIYCQNNGIKLTCVAEGSALDFMDIMDICSLFGNALDNAIESVKKIADPEKRLIHFSVAKQKGFLRIRVENCYEGDLDFADGFPLTTKRDKQQHGYGLKSIQKAARKYGGSATVETRDGWFELRILIPVPQ